MKSGASIFNLKSNTCIAILSYFLINLFSCNSLAETNGKETNAVTTVTIKPKIEKDVKVSSYLEPQLPDSILAKKKTVYFTCDDGPNFGSNIVMNIAKEENIPVNFFVVGFQYTGQTGKIFSKQWQRMHTQTGVEVYNHSFTHALDNHYEKYYANPGIVVNDFKRAADSGNFITTVTRTPGNNMWRTPTITHSTYKRYLKAVDSLHNAGFLIVGWDNEWFHHKMVLRQSPEQMAAEVDKMFVDNRTFTPHHIVILSHDQSFADAGDSAKLHQFIKILKANPDYRFENISRYPGLLQKN